MMHTYNGIPHSHQKTFLEFLMIQRCIHNMIFILTTWLPSVWSISCFSSGLLFISNLWMNSQSSAEIICPLESKNKLFLFSNSWIATVSKWQKNFSLSPLSSVINHEDWLTCRPYHQTNLSSKLSPTIYW